MTSKIEWTTETWNIITGCTKHSEGCKNCYAEKMHKRLTGMGQEKYKEPFSKVVFHSEELNRVIGKNKLVFCGFLVYFRYKIRKNLCFFLCNKIRAILKIE